MKQLTLHTGEKYTVSLEGSASGGYQWDYAVEGDGGVVAVSGEQRVDRPPEGSLPQTFEAQLVYGITALQPGRADVRFFLHRVWEADKPPLREERYAIAVTGKGNG